MYKVIIKETKETGDAHKTVHISKTMMTIGCNKEADIVLTIPENNFPIAEIINDRTKMFLTIKTDKIPVIIENRQLTINEITELKTLQFVTISNFTLAIEIIPDVSKDAVDKIPFDLIDNDEVMQPFIVIYKGKEELKVYKFIKDIEEITLGRDPECDLLINHTTVSRKHAKIKRDWAGFSIIDLSSTNGVFVNDVKITYNERIKDGDILRLGQSQELDPIYLIFKDPKALFISKMKEQAAKESKGPSVAPLTQAYPVEDKIYVKVPVKKSAFEKMLPYFAIVAILVIAGIFMYHTLILPGKQVPEIIATNPNMVNVGDEFIMQGTNFARTNLSTMLYVNKRLTPIIESSTTRIKAKMTGDPLQSAGIAKIPIQVQVGEKLSNVKEIQVVFSPVITAISSPKARGGEKVKIIGENFDKSLDTIKIWIASQSLKATKASNKVIEFEVPYIESNEEVVSNLYIEVNGYKSNALKFIVTRTIKDFYTVSFRTEKVKEQGAESFLIKTDICKVFQVTNKGSFGSIEARASAILSVLDEIPPLAEKELKIDIITEESPGGATLTYRAYSSSRQIVSKQIMEISVEDAAYYSTLLTMQLTPTDISNWLAAALNDMINLFASGDYPVNIGNMSPGAKVLKKIWNMFIRNNEIKQVPGKFLTYLNDQEKSYLAAICYDFPKQYRSISGKWIGTGDDLLMNAPDTYLTFQLSIDETKNGISGSLALGVSGNLDKQNTFYHNVGSFTIKEKFKNAKYKEFNFTADTQKFGTVVFSAQLIGSTLQGTYSVKNTQKVGFWRASFQPL